MSSVHFARIPGGLLPEVVTQRHGHGVVELIKELQHVRNEINRVVITCTKVAVTLSTRQPNGYTATPGRKYGRGPHMGLPKATNMVGE